MKTPPSDTHLPSCAKNGGCLFCATISPEEAARIRANIKTWRISDEALERAIDEAIAEREKAEQEKKP